MIIDALGQSFSTPLKKPRILSLVPSTTETLCELGLEQNIVGITRYCVHPPEIKYSAQVIGGTKQLNLKQVEQLNADLAIGNKEENTPKINNYFKSKKIPFFIAFPQNTDQAIDDILKLGLLFDKQQEAEEICLEIKERRSKLRSIKTSFTYAYLIWRRPWMSINSQTFIGAMLSEIGGQNIFADEANRYPEITLRKIVSKQPDVIFLSSEPYSFKPEHIQEIRDAGYANPIREIDGEYCSWHGVRMKRAFDYLKIQHSHIMGEIK